MEGAELIERLERIDGHIPILMIDKARRSVYLVCNQHVVYGREVAIEMMLTVPERLRDMGTVTEQVAHEFAYHWSNRHRQEREAAERRRERERKIDCRHRGVGEDQGGDQGM